MDCCPIDLKPSGLKIRGGLNFYACVAKAASCEMMRQTLKAIPLFKELADEDLDLIAAQLKKVSFAKGQTIFRQGDMGDGMYLVESGQVIVWDEKADEAIAYLGQGSFVGEIALLLAEPRSASLRVAIDADLYVLEKKDFDTLLETRPAIAIQMTRELSQRLVSTTQQRFKTKARRISAVWGVEDGELAKALSQYFKDPIAVIPLPGANLSPQLEALSEVIIIREESLSADNIASQLGIQVEVFGHIILLLPSKVDSLARRALSLADTIITIGPTPQWIEDNVPSEKIWETTNDLRHMGRIARRLTGRTVGLALSQGSAKGLAHVGVIKVLREANIPIDIIAGSSIGSLFGAFMAAGWRDEQFEEFADKTHSIVSNWLNWDFSLPPKGGLIKGSRVRDMIDEWLDHRCFEDLEIPFYCVAADIITGEEVIFNSGNLADAIRASISLPILFNPWELDGHYLMDGGLVNPIPADILRAKGADIVIASNVVEALGKSQKQKNGKLPHFLKIINNVVTLAAFELTKSQLDLIDVIIHSKVDVEHALDVKQARHFIDIGAEAARSQLAAIRTHLDVVQAT